MKPNLPQSDATLNTAQMTFKRHFKSRSLGGWIKTFLKKLLPH